MKTLFFSFALLLFTSLTAQTIWQKIPTGTHKKLNTIDFPSAKVGYIGGNDSLLLKTTDGGQTWAPLAVSGVTFYFGGQNIVNLDFVTETTGYLMVAFGSTYKTTDGGLTWVPVQPAAAMCYFGGLYFFDAQNGFIGGSGCFNGEVINKLLAGTFYTTAISHPTKSTLNKVVDIDFLDSSFGLAASRGGNIFRTTNGGMNWDSISSGMADTVPLTSVAVINNTLAYAGYNSSGSGAGLLRTTDGGLTWADDANAATFFYPAVFCVHEAGSGDVFAGAQPSTGNGGLIFEGTAGMWTVSTVDQPINDMASYSNTVVFGVGDSGYVVVNQSLSSVGMHEATTEGDLQFYPNPVDDLLHVQVPNELKDETATISIFSLYGQLIYKTADHGGEAIDLSELSPGMYILDLRAKDHRRHARVVKR